MKKIIRLVTFVTFLATCMVCISCKQDNSSDDNVSIVGTWHGGEGDDGTTSYFSTLIFSENGTVIGTGDMTFTGNYSVSGKNYTMTANIQMMGGFSGTGTFDSSNLTLNYYNSTYRYKR